MSATPLPPLPITPSPQQQQTSAPRSSSQQPSGTSFNSHLQSAQQQSSSDQAQNGSAAQDGNGNQNTAAQAGNASNNTAAPGHADASKQNDATNNSDIGIDLTGGIATLAGTMLSLIDHAASDTHGDATPATHAAPAKPVTQSANKQPATAQPNALAATMIPMPLPAAMTAATATTNSSVQAADGTAGALSQKASAFASTNADDASASATSSASVAADGGASTPTTSDNVQAFAAGLAAISHASAPSAASTITDSGSQGSPDLAALGSLAAAPTVPVSATIGATHNLAMNETVGSSGFTKELGQQITWLSGQEVKQAQIRLNPQDLGPLDVKVSVEHGRVDVSFMTQHPATAAAVQQGLDQLNQMLGGQGLSLGHATVGQHAQQQFGAQQGQQAQASGNTGDDVADTPAAVATRVAVGLVDAFA